MSIPAVRSRIVFLDWLRGLAAIVMLQGHTFDSFVRSDLREHPVFIFSQFFGGEAAAIFLFLTGITYGLGMNRRDDLPSWPRITGALRRARYLFLLAIAFRLQMWIFALPARPWTDLLHVDVLNLMGATAALLSVMALAHGMQRVRWAVCAGVALAGLAPVMANLNTGGMTCRLGRGLPALCVARAICSCWRSRSGSRCGFSHYLFCRGPICCVWTS